MVRYAARHGVKAIGVTLSKEQAAWAQKAIADEGPDRPRRGPSRRLPRHRRNRVRRGVLDRADRAHRRAELPVVLRVPASRRCAPARCCSTTASPGRTTGPAPQRAVSSTATCSPTASSPAPAGSSPRRRTSAWRWCTRRTCAHHYAMTLRDWCRNLVEHWDEAVAEVGLAHRQGVGPVHGRFAARLRDQCRSAAPGSGGQTRRPRRRRRAAAAAVVVGLTAVDAAGAEFVLK